MSEYNPNYLDFEQPLLDIENQITVLKTSANASQKDLKKIVLWPVVNFGEMFIKMLVLYFYFHVCVSVLSLFQNVHGTSEANHLREFVSHESCASGLVHALHLCLLLSLTNTI